MGGFRESGINNFIIYRLQRKCVKKFISVTISEFKKNKNGVI